MDYGDYILRFQAENGEPVTLWYITLSDALRVIREQCSSSVLLVHEVRGRQHVAFASGKRF